MQYHELASRFCCLMCPEKNKLIDPYLSLVEYLVRKYRIMVDLTVENFDEWQHFPANLFFLMFVL